MAPCRTTAGKLLYPLLLCALGLGLTAAAPRPPSGRWVVEFNDAQCLASRNYGTPDSPLLLVLKAPAAGNVIQLAVIRAATQGAAAQLESEVAIDQQAPLRAAAFAYTAAPNKQRAYLVNLPADRFAAAKTAKVLSIRAKGELDEQFAISAMGPLLQVMDECVADLRKAWNVAEAGAPGARLRQHATGSIDSMLQQVDYPAVDQPLPGTATFVLLVDETGRVADCTVIQTSGVASLDAQTCGAVKSQARFSPAIGLDGRPAKDGVVQRVSWILE
jgi:outer membrane biosynthesis protein TonB